MADEEIKLEPVGEIRPLEEPVEEKSIEEPVNKIRFNTSNGEILEVQSAPSHILVAGEGEVIESYEGSDKPYAGMLRITKDEVAFKPIDPAAEALINFNIKAVLPRMAEVFSAKILIFAPYFRLIEALLEFKNFTALKNILAGLVKEGIGTEKDIVDFKLILLEQNINLDKL